MATITIKNIPDELYERLKKKAEQERRSINSQAIVCLEQVLGHPREDTETILAEIRAHRDSLPYINMTPDEIEAAINEGPP